MSFFLTLGFLVFILICVCFIGSLVTLFAWFFFCHLILFWLVYNLECIQCKAIYTVCVKISRQKKTTWANKNFNEAKWAIYGAVFECSFVQITSTLNKNSQSKQWGRTEEIQPFECCVACGEFMQLCDHCGIA